MDDGRRPKLMSWPPIPPVTPRFMLRIVSPNRYSLSQEGASGTTEFSSIHEALTHVRRLPNTSGSPMEVYDQGGNLFVAIVV